MSTKAERTIPGTEESWDEGILGCDEKFVGQLSEEELAADMAAIQAAMGLQPISIRLEKSLIEDFKAIALLHGLGYQTLMRQALKRFADCEKKRLLNEAASKMRAVREAEQQAALVEKKPAKKKAA